MSTSARAAVLAGLASLAAVAALGAGAATPATKVYRVDWRGSLQVESGEVRFRVTRLELGRRGWNVSASIANRSRRAVSISRKEPDSWRICRTGLISFVREDGPYGAASYGSRPFLAESFAPRPPSLLLAGESWRGTFGARTPLPRRTLVYVCVGWLPSSQDGAGVSWISDRAVQT